MFDGKDFEGQEADNVGGSGEGQFKDRVLVCQDCGQEFTFTAGEQEFYAEKGFKNEPKRCKECRDARKRGSSERQMTEVPCSTPGCKNIAKVPFVPSAGRPVYCSECYAKMQDDRQEND